jgi:hypothetical protein
MEQCCYNNTYTHTHTHFELCHYLEDNVYLEILVNVLLCSKSKLSVNQISVNIQNDIYMFTPYYFLPEKMVITNWHFLKIWLNTNNSKKIKVNNKTYYHQTIYYPSGNVESITPYCDIVNLIII